MSEQASGLRVSARQQRLWLLERLGALAEASTVARAVAGPARAAPAALAAALEREAARHPILRLRFEGEGEPQAFVDGAPLRVETVWSAAGAAEAARAWREGLEPFSMKKGGLVRAAVVAALDGCVVAIAAHASIADGRGLDALLAAALAGRELVPVQPGGWGEVAPAAIESRLAHARRCVAEVDEPAELAGDRPRPPVQTGRARSSSHRLDPALFAELDRLAKLARAPEGHAHLAEAPYLAAFGVLIGRYARKRDVVLGRRVWPPGDGLGPREVDALVRLKLGGRPRALDLVRAASREILESEDLGGLPFELVLRELKPPRDPSRAPLFQVRFSFEERPELPAGWAYVDLPRRGSPFDLELAIEVRRGPGGPEAWATVVEALDLFQDAGRAGRLVGHLETLLRGFVERPEAPVDELPMVTEAERRELVWGYNPVREFPSDDTIAARVERAARARPEAIAVSSGDERLTYGELEARATRLARRLRELGVGRDERVGVCLERTPRLIVALYAVLKAGGAYVPVEPTLPKERLEFVLGDAEPKVVLVEGELAERLEGSGVPLVRLDALEAELGAGPPGALAPPEAPAGASPADALAYIIYTSGSTGKPKGCLVDNRHVVRLFDATHAWFGFDERDVWTMFHSVAFDFSVWEIWGALCYGGRVVVVPYRVTRSPDDFRRLCEAEGVTVLNQTPSAFRQFIEADRRSGGGPLALRTVVFGGEALELESLRPWFDRHGDERPRLVNMYGITETTVHVTYRPIAKRDLEAGFASVIGVPIPDLAAYVVDEDLQLVPVGVPGEMLVGGAGVSRGYFRRPELSAQRFLPDLFSGRAEGRVYRSGDLVRRLQGGELDYLGRIDQQVKIRGFRIETGDVEAALRRGGLVRDVTVVTAKKPGGGEAALVAYVVSDAGAHELRAAARSSLPEYMVPAVFVPVGAIPMTGNGKVDRRALPDPWAAAAEGAEREPFVPPRGPYEEAVAQAFAEALGRARLGARAHLFDEGGSSLEAVRAAERVGELLGVACPVVALFEHPTVEALAAHLEGERAAAAAPAPKGGEAAPAARGERDDDAVAIVGMAGRFPGADDLDTYWTNLLEGRESITFFGPGGLDPSLDPALTARPDYVRARGVLSDPAGFDAGFFGMSPREAEVTDPQQRLALELAWEALEDAGYDPARPPGLVGVYAGEYNVTYYIEHVLRRPDVVERAGAFQAMVGNEKDFIATRIAHKLDLRGPALSIHTACSTALVAVAQAFYALRTRQCDLALAGAAAVSCPPASGYLYQEGGMLSVDGRTRPFDRDARGTVFSDGGGFVVLKRLADALRDGDRVVAILRGAATNNDGAAKSSFSAPSAAGQAEVIARALEVAGAEPASLSYVEAHGTATPLGDPIELEGLKRAFGARGGAKGRCGIGSVKSNFGHVVAASGAAGLIKTALALAHEVIPPTINFKAPNPKLGLEGSPFYVVAEPTPWPRGRAPRRAGVSSFGVGGTNAHVVVEEAPAPLPSPRPSKRSWQIVPLSARSERALGEAGRRLSAALAAAGAEELADASFTLALGRRAFAQRRAVVARGGAELAKALAAPPAPSVARARPSFTFAFPGQGSQYVAMGRALAREEPAFRDALAECVALLRGGREGPGGPLACDLGPVLDPAPGDEARAEALLVQTAYTQPALFAVEYALARLWLSLGLRPEVLVGHSVGEFVAACLAGVFSLEDALRLVYHRGRLMQAAPPGVMLSVRAPAADVAPELSGSLGLSAVNAPKLCVVGGPEAEIAELERRLGARGVATSRLRTSHAFHSPMMEGAVGPFLELVRQVPLGAPSLPIVSTLTGAPLSAAQATDPAYWARHLRETVRFSDALAALYRENPERVVLELGPRATLTTLAKQIAPDPKRNAALATLDVGSAAGEPDEPLAFARALGQAWALGAPVDWGAYFAGEARRRARLPTYPFERQRHWVDPPPFAPSAPAKAPTAEAPARAPSPEALTALTVTAAPAAPPPAAQPQAPQPAPMQAAPARPADRRPALLDAVRQVFEEASGVELAEADPSASFMELGLDSLSLTQCAQLLARRLACEISFRQLVEDFISLESLVAHLDATLPPEAHRPAAAAPAPAPAAAAPAAHAPAAPAPGPIPAMAPAPAPAAYAPLGGSFEAPAGAFAGSPEAARIVSQQLELMARQLDLLRGSLGVAATAGPIVAAVAPASAPAAAPAPQPNGKAAGEAVAGNGAPAANGGAAAPAAAAPASNGAAKAAAPAGGEADEVPKKAFGAGARIEKTGAALPPDKQAALEAFMAAYVARTGGSKRYTAEHRARLADPRAVTGFKPMWKEIVYPLVVGRSDGAYLWDVDGNRYVDVTCGFGANFLGHRPPYVVKAVQAQLEAGFEIGPQHPLSGECARLLCELTGHERAAFCNTGSEAVLAATRLARTVSGRPLMVTFTGDYHGILDEVIVRGTKSLRSVPASPGILPSAVQNNLVLDYGEDSALEIIEKRAGDVAAVVVEPVQSRRPDLQPRAFLHKLRALTEKKGIALVFDEIITGFRLCPGGAQEYFGVKADLATYGKILGGGLPIGAIAGARKYMDALDGGGWSYGDASVPEVGVTYFAGTFVRHPLALAACKASLEHLRDAGPELQRRVNERNAALVAEINAFFKRAEAPYELTSCGSWFKLSYPDDLPFGGLLFFWLRHKGVHIWDGRVAFLTTAHTDEDCAFVRDAFAQSVREMQAAGFLPKPTRADAFASPPVPGARLGKNQDGSPAWFVPDPARPGKYLLYTAPLTAPLTAHRRESPVTTAPPDALQPVDFDPFAEGELVDAAPATSAQREIWVACQMGDDASLAYNESITLTFRGPFDEGAMRAAIEALPGRHEALRSTLSRDGKSLCVGASAPVPIEAFDFAALPEGEREARLGELVRRESSTPFDLDRGPLFRAAIVRMADDEHRLILGAHHVVCDGWSFAVLLKDLAPLYNARRAGQAPQLPAAHSFSAYAREEAGRDGAREEAYWLARLDPAPPPLELPTDRPRPRFREVASGRVDLPLAPEAVAALKRAGARQGASFFVTLLAGFAAFLGRLGGQRDLVIGIPAAGQNAVGREMLVGHCANLLPLRLEVDPARPFADLLKAARRAVLDAYDHQRITLGDLVGKVKAARDPGRLPLVSVLFNLDTGMEGSGLRFEGLETSFRSNPRVAETFELFVNAFESKGGVVLECQYAAALWDEGTVRAWLEGYCALLAAALAAPETPAGALPAVGEADRRRMLTDWNATARPVAPGETLLDLVAEQAARRPEHVALADARGESLTYAELVRRARALAGALARRGVGRGDLVALCLDRSVWSVVLPLAVLEAGAAYVPIDPEFPPARVEAMARTAKLCVSEPGASDALEDAGLDAVDLGDLRREAERAPAAGEPPAARPGPGDRAYVIFTSGSTGAPKGVEVTHAGLVNFVTSMRRDPGAGERDVLVAVVTASFDISGYEMYVPLAAGGTVVVADQDTTRDGRALAELMRERGATLFQATPSTYRLLRAGGYDPRGLVALAGGEALPPEIAAWLLEGGARLVNVYGPTETTIWSTAHAVTDARPPIPIGRPIDNTSVYVLDAALAPRPVGAYGEIYIGGLGVALGYLGRPGATAERFLPDPFSPAPGARMYRTGDLGRFRHDGAIEYAGRGDQQVKVRGHRIELGEIEAALGRHPALAEAAAAVVREAGADDRLVAFYVPRPGRSTTDTDLRKHLRRDLPKGMIPQIFVELRALPRTPNNKLDRPALARLGVGERRRERAPAPPSSDAERLLAGLFRRALKAPEVGADDNFFDLGGDSVLAMELVVELERATGVRVSPRLLLLSSLGDVARSLGPVRAP
ncbi:MAG TPA: amino acid adenylation domain-containing protein [Polyangiaceae bacterium]|nr:amino acid adenylation domain-containing protein [Polyangiaceae bacterium]